MRNPILRIYILRQIYHTSNWYIYIYEIEVHGNIIDNQICYKLVKADHANDLSKTRMFIYEINCQQQYFQHNSPVCLDLRAWWNIPSSMLLQKHMRFTKITGKTRHRPSADGISETNTTRQTSHSFINSYVVQINTKQFNVWNETRNGYVSWYIYRF